MTASKLLAAFVSRLKACPTAMPCRPPQDTARTRRTFGVAETRFPRLRVEGQVGAKRASVRRMAVFRAAPSKMATRLGPFDLRARPCATPAFVNKFDAFSLIVARMPLAFWAPLPLPRRLRLFTAKYIKLVLAMAMAPRLQVLANGEDTMA